METGTLIPFLISTAISVCGVIISVIKVKTMFTLEQKKRFDMGEDAILNNTITKVASKLINEKTTTIVKDECSTYLTTFVNKFVDGNVVDSKIDKLSNKLENAEKDLSRTETNIKEMERRVTTLGERLVAVETKVDLKPFKKEIFK